MRYIIYDRVGEKEFIEIKERLNNIETIASPLMQMSGFYLNRRQYKELLSLDYVHEDNEYMGNVGLKYDEEGSGKSEMVFKFYILKAYDENGRRFYKKSGLDERFTIEQVEKDFVSLFQKCLIMYDLLNKEDLTDSVLLKK